LISQADVWRRWYLLTTMVGVYAISIADRYVISTVLEPIKLELQLSDSGIAFLTGVSLALFYVFFSIPLAWLMDRGNRRTLIALSLALWSLMTVMSGLSRNYWQLLISRFGVGIGEGGATPGANSLISDYFPPVRRPMALSIFALGAPIGSWLGADVGGRIADLYGWRAVFLALGVPGMVAGLVILLTVKEPLRGRFETAIAAEPGASAPVSFAESMVALWKNRPAVHLIAAATVATLWGWGLMWWTPAYLMRSFGLSAGEAGGLIGPMHLFGGAGAIALIGWVVTWPSMVAPHRIPWVLGIIITGGTVASIALYASHSLAETKLLFWVFIPSIYVTIGPSFGLLNNLADPRMRAMFCAVVLFTSNVTNLVVAPQLIGFLSDLFGGRHGGDAASLRLALICLTPTGFWAAYHFARCSQILKRQRCAELH
jgi:MFS family permease